MQTEAPREEDGSGLWQRKLGDGAMEGIESEEDMEKGWLGKGEEDEAQSTIDTNAMLPLSIQAI